MTTARQESAEAAIRELYDEYEADGTRIAVITDPENPDAWIESDIVHAIVQ